MNKKQKIAVVILLFLGSCIVTGLIWQHAVYRRVTDPECKISFGEYFEIRSLIILNPVGEFITDRFVLKISPGWPSGLHIKTGREGEKRTGEGGIYLLQKENDKWVVSGTGIWVGVGGGRHRTPVKVSEEDWPKTLDEAASRIIDQMKETDKKRARDISAEELAQFHMSWGMSIRNSFGLWKENDSLLRSCGVEHPDDASGVIIENVWRKLNQVP
jgi:hypothetical protein